MEHSKYNLDDYEPFDSDKIVTFEETQIGLKGMKIDRLYYEKFEEDIKKDQNIIKNI